MSRLFVQLYAGTNRLVRGLPAYWLANSPPPHVGSSLLGSSNEVHPIGLRKLGKELPTFVASALDALLRSGIGFADRFRLVGATGSTKSNCVDALHNHKSVRPFYLAP